MENLYIKTKGLRGIFPTAGPLIRCSQTVLLATGNAGLNDAAGDAFADHPVVRVNDLGANGARPLRPVVVGDDVVDFLVTVADVAVRQAPRVGVPAFADNDTRVVVAHKAPSACLCIASAVKRRNHAGASVDELRRGAERRQWCRREELEHREITCAR